MKPSSTAGLRIGVTVVLLIAACCATAWIQHAHAQAIAQIGPNAPLPVFVANQVQLVTLPDGFVHGSHWRFTTWSAPSAVSWTATVNKTSGAWANLTITASNTTQTAWVYLPSLPGTWTPE